MQWTFMYTKTYKICNPLNAVNELNKIAEEQREKHGSRFVRRKPMAVAVHPSRDEMLLYSYRLGEIIEEKFVWM